jgi:hypothetical protein
MANGRPGAPFGNTNASAEKPWRNALNRAIAQDDHVRLRQAAEQLLTQAASGESWAIKELGDRLDGKPHQQVAVTGADNGPLTVEIVRFMNATDTNPQ